MLSRSALVDSETRGAILPKGSVMMLEFELGDQVAELKEMPRSWAAGRGVILVTYCLHWASPPNWIFNE